MRLLAAAATAVGLIATGFDAHLAPQMDGWWHGLTGSPSPLRVTTSLLAALLVWGLGRVVNVRPFLWMSAGLLPFVPAITGFGAPLLFFSGYTMGLLFAILLGGTVLNRLPRLPALDPFSVALISFAFFILVGRVLPGPAGPQGDEPHYLLIAESLLKDGDVDLKNQFEQRAFSKFTGADLEPHTAPRSPRGKLYAIHTPGLSAHRNRATEQGQDIAPLHSITSSAPATGFPRRTWTHRGNRRSSCDSVARSRQLGRIHTAITEHCPTDWAPRGSMRNHQLPERNPRRPPPPRRPSSTRGGAARRSRAGW